MYATLLKYLRQLKVPRLSKDANNNTVLRDAVGAILPMLGANTITVGAGGMYATIREALDYIVSQDTYTDLNVAGVTSSVTQNTNLVTLVGTDVYEAAPFIHIGDLWSGDNGVNWYEISAMLSPTKLTVEVPYYGATLSGGTTKFARPVWYSIVLLPGDHGDAGQLTFPNTKPVYVDIQAHPGARFTGDSTADAQIWSWPCTGHVILRNLAGVATKRQSAFFGSASAGGKHVNSIIELNTCDIRSQGVDVWIPSGPAGKLIVRGGYYEAGQDLFVNTAPGGLFFYGATLVGTGLVYFFSGALAIRMFDAMGNDVYAKDCTFEIRHPIELFTGVSSVIDAGGSSAFTFTADNCTLNINVVGAATTACFVGDQNSTGVIGRKIKLNNCVMNSIHASGTPNVMKAVAYTGTGTVAVNNCVLNGFVAGGGGTVIPSLNSCTA